MMTKKDFDKVATIIYRLPIEVRVQAVGVAVQVLDSEPKFDRIKFSFMAGVFPCLKCDLAFQNSTNLAAHRSDVHDKEEVNNAHS